MAPNNWSALLPPGDDDSGMLPRRAGWTSVIDRRDTCLNGQHTPRLMPTIPWPFHPCPPFGMQVPHRSVWESRHDHLWHSSCVQNDPFKPLGVIFFSPSLNFLLWEIGLLMSPGMGSGRDFDHSRTDTMSTGLASRAPAGQRSGQVRAPRP